MQCNSTILNLFSAATMPLQVNFPDFHISMTAYGSRSKELLEVWFEMCNATTQIHFMPISHGQKALDDIYSFK